MARNLSILLALAVILALPFMFRQETGVREWRAGDPVLVVITPMNTLACLPPGLCSRSGAFCASRTWPRLSVGGYVMVTLEASGLLFMEC